MSDLFLSRIRLKPEAASDEAFWRYVRQLSSHHQLVWRFFKAPDGSERDFLYRIEGEGMRMCFYTLSAREPRDELGLFEIDPPKPYRPALRKGQLLELSLRANPVVRVDDEADRYTAEQLAERAVSGKSERARKGKKHDVVMVAKKRAGPGASTEAELVEKAGLDWLEKAGERAGFRFARGDMRATGYQQHRVFRGANEAPMRFSSIDFDGRIEVTNPASMLEASLHGLGRARGFGCGLMLLKRARPRDDDE